MRATRREFRRVGEEFHDSSFMAQRDMWHLMEQRMRDAIRGETKESEHVVRECKTLWMKKSHGLDGIMLMVKEGFENQPRECKKPKREDNMKRRVNNEANLGRRFFDCDEEGHRVELDFEAVKRVKLQEEHRRTALVKEDEGFQRRKQNKK